MHNFWWRLYRRVHRAMALTMSVVGIRNSLTTIDSNMLHDRMSCSSRGLELATRKMTLECMPIRSTS